MIISFLPIKQSPEASVSYLEGNISAKGVRRASAPKALHGDSNRWLRVVGASNLKNPFLSAVLSFSEDSQALGELPSQATEEFFELLTGGVEPERVCWFSIQHQRENGMDVHVFIAKNDLYSGRQIPLWSGSEAEVEGLGWWRRKFNLEHGLADPNDPWRRKFHARFGGRDTTENVPELSPKGGRYDTDLREECVRLDAEVVELCAAGLIRTREDLENFLELNLYETRKKNQHGYVVSDGRNTIKFSGGKYAAGFNYDEIRRARGASRERDVDATAAEIRRLGAQLEGYGEDRKRLFRRFEIGTTGGAKSRVGELAQAYAVQLGGPDISDYRGFSRLDVSRHFSADGGESASFDASGDSIGGVEDSGGFERPVEPIELGVGSASHGTVLRLGRKGLLEGSSQGDAKSDDKEQFRGDGGAHGAPLEGLNTNSEHDYGPEQTPRKGIGERSRLLRFISQIAEAVERIGLSGQQLERSDHRLRDVIERADKCFAARRRTHQSIIDELQGITTSREQPVPDESPIGSGGHGDEGTITFYPAPREPEIIARRRRFPAAPAIKEREVGHEL